MQISERKAFSIIIAVSTFVFLTVVVLSQLPHSETVPTFVIYLPRLNALINSLCTILLVSSWFAIKSGRIDLHRRLNLTTFGLSSLFLVSYVVFHAFGVKTYFPSDHPWRTFYLIILSSHIILAALVLPLVLASFYFALAGRIDSHRKIVRFSFPIWLYVTSTGVIVYLMISPYYAF